MIDKAGLQEFLDLHRKLVIGITSGVIFLLLLILILTVSAGTADTDSLQRKSENNSSMAIPLREMWLPEEPLRLPDIELYRKQKPVWDSEDSDRWFVAPDESAIEALREINRKKIEALLETVP